MTSPLVVCRVAWMDHYRGDVAKDRPTGGGSWVKRHGFGHEALNFAPVGNEYFGYVQPKGSGINLMKLGAGDDASSLDGVTVVWVATNPTKRGMRIVGWYRNATVFRELQAPVSGQSQLPGGIVPKFLARSREAVLLSGDERLHVIPRGVGGMGQANVWYPDAASSLPILEYVATRGRSAVKASVAKPKLVDVERRLRIEKTAMNSVATWFADLGYAIEDVSMKKVGWDLEARLDGLSLLLEVKGTSVGHDDFHVEVTPNEFAQMNNAELRSSYRLCIVTDAEHEPHVTVFSWSNETQTWCSGDGTRHLQLEERVAARVTLRA